MRREWSIFSFWFRIIGHVSNVRLEGEWTSLGSGVDIRYGPFFVLAFVAHVPLGVAIDVVPMFLHAGPRSSGDRAPLS